MGLHHDIRRLAVIDGKQRVAQGVDPRVHRSVDLDFRPCAGEVRDGRAAVGQSGDHLGGQRLHRFRRKPGRGLGKNLLGAHENADVERIVVGFHGRPPGLLRHPRPVEAESRQKLHRYVSRGWLTIKVYIFVQTIALKPIKSGKTCPVWLTDAAKPAGHVSARPGRVSLRPAVRPRKSGRSSPASRA